MNGYRILEGKPEGKRPLETPRYRWADNIKLHLRGGLGWTDLAQDRDDKNDLVNMEINM
jgi:hypothetical protein